MAVASDFVCKW